MLKILIVAAGLLFACVIAAPIESHRFGFFPGHEVAIDDETKEPVAIINNFSSRSDDGSFIFAYEAADGSFREEVGKVINAGTDEQEIEISGTYRYYDANGELIEVKYTAGKDGFLPVGTNILPAISAAAKAAAEAATNYDELINIV